MAKSKTPGTQSFETGMLAYARSLQISEGVFFGIDGDKRVPVEVLEKGVRGQSSEDRARNPGLSNPQTVEFAVLPQGCTAVELAFSVRVLPMAMSPHACGSPSVATAYETLATSYARAGGFDVLAARYVWNIANARFAWRNRFQVDTSRVTVGFAGQVLVFDPARLSLDRLEDADTLAAALLEGDRTLLGQFISGISGGMTTAPFWFEVTWRGEMPPGQEIFPSQEYIRESKAEKDVSRIYAKLPRFHAGREIGHASMHSQKIGAALRHIDDWHGDDGYGPIAVNPYGGVQETADVLRRAKNSFYDIRKKADEVLAIVQAANSAEDLPGSVHFLMANLVRGGVFGSSSKAAEANG
ncbi:type I-F CRISPR-associated protein Csy3 [Frigidibacter sp. MR17.24]|uniref:type I-F CRISPR-associated protein Csy3 n=1 Tax=Frigidibacter sp. MR17.24 TaxID=3127345 RepID=UPI003012B80C